MMLYILYRIGNFLAVLFPRKICYKMACLIADMYCYCSRRDKEAVKNNIRVILGNSCDEAELNKMARDVFRNFAKYLVDFFSFSKVDHAYIKKFVKLEGAEHIETGLAKGKGIIMLSAHIGNWELGGSVLSMAGYPLSAVVLTHQNKMINDFFKKQRLLGKMRPIEIGISLKSCYTTLRSNGLLALLGDRDFSKNGIYIEFFGKKTLMPRGPAALSCKLGSVIVPCFMLREPDDTLKLVCEPPIYPDCYDRKEDDVEQLAKKYLVVIESYIKKYPTQWYVFKDMWNNNEENLRPDTII